MQKKVEIEETDFLRCALTRRPITVFFSYGRVSCCSGLPLGFSMYKYIAHNEVIPKTKHLKHVFDHHGRPLDGKAFEIRVQLLVMRKAA